MKRSRWEERAEILLIVWAVMAVLVYFVQKATVEYTFDYGFLFEPKYEERFKGALQLLPPGEKIEYITDPPGFFGKEKYLQRQRWAQYLLTPYLNEARYVLSDFHSPTDLHEIAEDRQLLLIKDFGNGVGLFKHGDTD